MSDENKNPENMNNSFQLNSESDYDRIRTMLSEASDHHSALATKIWKNQTMLDESMIVKNIFSCQVTQCSQLALSQQFKQQDLMKKNLGGSDSRRKVYAEEERRRKEDLNVLSTKLELPIYPNTLPSQEIESTEQNLKRICKRNILERYQHRKDELKLNDKSIIKPTNMIKEKAYRRCSKTSSNKIPNDFIQEDKARVIKNVSQNIHENKNYLPNTKLRIIERNQLNRFELNKSHGTESKLKSTTKKAYDGKENHYVWKITKNCEKRKNKEPHNSGIDYSSFRKKKHNSASGNKSLRSVKVEAKHVHQGTSQESEQKKTSKSSLENTLSLASNMIDSVCCENKYRVLPARDLDSEKPECYSTAVQPSFSTSQYKQLNDKLFGHNKETQSNFPNWHSSKQSEQGSLPLVVTQKKSSLVQKPMPLLYEEETSRTKDIKYQSMMENDNMKIHNHILSTREVLEKLIETQLVIVEKLGMFSDNALKTNSNYVETATSTILQGESDEELPSTSLLIDFKESSNSLTTSNSISILSGECLMIQHSLIDSVGTGNVFTTSNHHMNESHSHFKVDQRTDYQAKEAGSENRMDFNLEKSDISLSNKPTNNLSMRTLHMNESSDKCDLTDQDSHSSGCNIEMKNHDHLHKKSFKLPQKGDSEDSCCHADVEKKSSNSDFRANTDTLVPRRRSDRSLGEIEETNEKEQTNFENVSSTESVARSIRHFVNEKKKDFSCKRYINVKGSLTPGTVAFSYLNPDDKSGGFHVTEQKYNSVSSNQYQVDAKSKLSGQKNIIDDENDKQVSNAISCDRETYSFQCNHQSQSKDNLDQDYPLASNIDIFLENKIVNNRKVNEENIKEGTSEASCAIDQYESRYSIVFKEEAKSTFDSLSLAENIQAGNLSISPTSLSPNTATSNSDSITNSFSTEKIKDLSPSTSSEFNWEYGHIDDIQSCIASVNSISYSEIMNPFILLKPTVNEIVYKGNSSS